MTRKIARCENHENHVQMYICALNSFVNIFFSSILFRTNQVEGDNHAEVASQILNNAGAIPLLVEEILFKRKFLT